ncbi:MAG: hypothetical protein C5B56_00560 [Proteobacteria bacterium]|nr:MAG: hypothetical protein C5B56_00560 [Pseudomonadota bacterium]
MADFEDVPEGYDPDSKVARFFGVHVKTIARWDHRPELNFPAAIRVNDRKYRSRREYHDFARRAAVAHASKPSPKP